MKVKESSIISYLLIADVLKRSAPCMNSRTLCLINHTLVTHTYIDMQTQVWLPICISKYVHSFMNTCLHTYLYTYFHTYIHTYACVSAYIHKYQHAFSIYMHVYTHTCMHTYIHTHAWLRVWTSVFLEFLYFQISVFLEVQKFLKYGTMEYPQNGNFTNTLLWNYICLWGEMYEFYVSYKYRIPKVKKLEELLVASSPSHWSVIPQWQIQLGETENLHAWNTEYTLFFFMLSHLCRAAKWRQLGLLSFKDKLLTTFHP